MIVHKTYLMNSSKKEYINIGNNYPNNLSTYLIKLEKLSNWNLRHDHIYIYYSCSSHGYTNVIDKITF